MSLVTLLAEYPNYSARKVRRLAKQLAALEKACDPTLLPEQRGIAQDLMEFNLLQAKTEAQLNDDVKVEDQALGANLVPQPNQTVERITVTPLDVVTQMIREFEQLGMIEDEDGSAHQDMAARARGLVNSKSFTAERITTHEDDGSRSVSTR